MRNKIFLSVLTFLVFIFTNTGVLYSQSLSSSSFIKDSTDPSSIGYWDWLKKNVDDPTLSVLAPTKYGCPSNSWGGTGSFNNFEDLNRSLTRKISMELSGFTAAAKKKCLSFSFIIRNGKITNHPRNKNNFYGTTANGFFVKKVSNAKTISRYSIMVRANKIDVFDNNLQKFCSGIFTFTDEIQAKGELSCNGFKSMPVVIRYKDQNDWFIVAENNATKLFFTKEKPRKAKAKYPFYFTAWTDDDLLERHNKPDLLYTEFGKLNSRDRKLIQSNLKNLGHYNSSIDGLYGRNTAAALNSYNKKYLKGADLDRSDNVKRLFLSISEYKKSNVEPMEVAKVAGCDDNASLCTVVQLCQKASSNINGKLNWNSAASAQKYVDFAKSKGLTCDVQQKENDAAVVLNCNNDPTKCSIVELCQKSTGTASSGEKFWRMDASQQAYVETAKLAGLTCNVATEALETSQGETCESDPTKCSMIELCAKASGTTSSGEKFWRLDVEFQEYVSAAKTIAVTCGVQQAVVASAQPVSVPKTQKAPKYINRKALVIGNANYVDQPPLKNPINDAKAVAAKLEQVGFEVTYKEDVKYRDFGRALADFERGLGGSDMSLFYYAGHGIEVDKKNYLIPIDAELRSPIDARYETVMLDDAISASLNTGRLSMVLIDACRDNPFVANMDVKTRSVGRGLSIVEIEKGNVNQIVSFAASSGEVAEDGSGQNSPYASAIIDLLDEPNLEIGKMFRLVRDRVTDATGGKQKPVVNQDLSGEDIFLVVE